MFRQNVACKPLKKLSTWRRISLATWNRPQDPSVYGSIDMDMTKGLAFIEQFQKKTGKKLTLTHLLIKGVAKTLAKFPELNVLIRHNRIYTRDHVDIFVQVFSEEKENPDLSGARIRDPHEKSFEEIIEALTKQSQKIRQGEDPNLKTAKNSLYFFPPLLLKWAIHILSYIGYDLNISPSFLKLPPDPFGAAMISNVGMFGLKAGYAPLVPFSRTPMVLVAGKVIKKAVVENDQVVIRPMLELGVTVDHRIIDGYMAGLAASYLKNLLENPELF